MTTPYSYAAGQPTFPSQTPPNQTQTFTNFTSVLSKSLDQQYLPSPTRGRPRGSLTGAKRGRRVHWTLPPTGGVGGVGVGGSDETGASLTLAAASRIAALPTLPTLPTLSSDQLVASRPVHSLEEDAEGEDELLPAMADDDYSAQLSWQSQSKDNLKVLMDNFSTAQYDRFEAYRRHALPKQAVRKVIQQTLGQQVSQPVAQIIAGFSKVFVGEIIEQARAVQTRRGETGPLSPDHLREAYRAYQDETGHVGAARPLRAKKLFVR